jgi:hypothetical protein
MTLHNFKVFLCIFCLYTTTAFHAKLQAQPDQQHTLVAMRTIGHRVLLSVGDSTSLVLPVVQEGNRYKISFDTEFIFKPLDLARAIDEVMHSSQVARRYIAEVAQCQTGEIVYSYEITGMLNTDLVPCAARIPSLDCYALYITLLDVDTAVDTALAQAQANRDHTSAGLIVLSALLVLGVVMVYYFRKKRPTPAHPDAVNIGKYVVDKRNMELRLGDQKTELTGKETDLLILLHSAVNTTLERERILQTVWGDEGDYIGRTLDVFISKLRKKLEADPTVKIANIRGIGYKLVVNDGP